VTVDRKGQQIGSLYCPVLLKDPTKDAGSEPKKDNTGNILGIALSTLSVLAGFLFDDWYSGRDGIDVLELKVTGSRRGALVSRLREQRRTPFPLDDRFKAA
jgi:hypothetical protein